MLGGPELATQPVRGTSPLQSIPIPARVLSPRFRRLFFLLLAFFLTVFVGGGLVVAFISIPSGGDGDDSGMAELSTDVTTVRLRSRPRDRLSRSEHGLLGADKSKRAYHPNFGVWVSRFPDCSDCTENCAEKHRALFDTVGEEGELRQLDLEIEDRRLFYATDAVDLDRKQQQPQQLALLPANVSAAQNATAPKERPPTKRKVLKAAREASAAHPPRAVRAERRVPWRHPGEEQQQLGDEMYDALFGPPPSASRPSAFTQRDGDVNVTSMNTSSNNSSNTRNSSQNGPTSGSDSDGISGEFGAAPSEFTKRYIAKKLQILAEDMFLPWELNGGIDLDKQVNMVTCSFVTRMRWNAFGVWVHVSGNTLTLLRAQVDGLGRTMRMVQYLRRLVAKGPPFEKPLVVYVNVMDFPCNVLHPYLNFHTKQGVRGIVIPDDRMGKWAASRASLLNVSQHVPYGERNNSIFFIGSPNHPVRDATKLMLMQSAYANQTDITIQVLEHKAFRHLSKPMPYHTNYRFILSIRGRTASARDVAFQAVNSTVVRIEDDDAWLQFYHVLWEPYRHYVPLHPSNTTERLCTLRRMMGPPEERPTGKRAVADVIYDYVPARKKLVGRHVLEERPNYIKKEGNFLLNERIAADMASLGEALTQEVVDNFFRYVLRRWADMQRYEVHPDAVQFLQGMSAFVKRRHSGLQIIPDDGSPVKYFFHRWLKRRWMQVRSCRDPDFAKLTNGTMKGCVTYI